MPRNGKKHLWTKSEMRAYVSSPARLLLTRRRASTSRTLVVGVILSTSVSSAPLGSRDGGGRTCCGDPVSLSRIGGPAARHLDCIEKGLMSGVRLIVALLVLCNDCIEKGLMSGVRLIVALLVLCVARSASGYAVITHEAI